MYFIVLSAILYIYSFFINFFLCLVFINKGWFLTRPSLCFSFQTLVGNIFFSMGFNTIHNAVEILFQNAQPTDLSNKQCLIDITFQSFGIILVTLSVTFIALERYLVVAHNRDFFKWEVLMISFSCYVTSFLISIGVYLGGIGSRRPSGGCQLKDNYNSFFSQSINKFLFSTLSICLIVTYVSYLLLLRKVFQVSSKSEKSSSINRPQNKKTKTLRRVLCMISIHFVLNLPIIVSKMIIPSDWKYANHLFYVSNLMLHLFGVTEPLLLIFYDTEVRSKIEM